MINKELSFKRADVSVIIPVYNSGEEAYRAVKSIANQTLLPLEVILIDDCSPKLDETRVWLSKIQDDFGDKFALKVLYQVENKGPGEARNVGWDIAKGKYVAFLDSDDVWHPQKMNIQYNFIIRHPDVGFSCHHLAIISTDKIQSFYHRNLMITDNNFIRINPTKYLFKHYPIGGTSYVMAKNIKDIRFMPGKRYSEDYLVWLEFCYKYGGVLIDEFMGASFKPFYGAGGLSQSLWKLEKGELENYRILYSKKMISFLTMISASVFSFVKFLRRILLLMS